jgi:Tfp pilus assembly protein PilN
MRKVVTGLEERGDSPVEILQHLSEGLPKSCWLNEFRYEAGKTVVLRGNALSNSAVADAVYVLANRPEFDKVSLDYSNLGRNGSSQVYDFEIKCDLPPKDSLVLLSKSAKETKNHKKGGIAR